MHTPSLYSVFLRALLSAKVDPPAQNALPSDGQETEPMKTEADSSAGESHNRGVHVDSSGVMESTDAPQPVNIEQQQQQQQPLDFMSEFQFASEMGPVADMSTFPPTMAVSRPGDDSVGMLSMDSILSSAFWDNVLVPGKSTSSLVGICADEHRTV